MRGRPEEAITDLKVLICNFKNVADQMQSNLCPAKPQQPIKIQIDHKKDDLNTRGLS